MIRSIIFLLFIFLSCHLYSQSYQRLHRKALVVDTHNDIMINILEGLSIETDLDGKTHSDLARFAKGGVDVQIFSIWSDERYGAGKGFYYANRQIDSLYNIVQRNPERMMLVTNPAELQTAVRQKKFGAMLGLEGGHMIEDSLAYLESLYHRGIRYMTLTWNNSTNWATSAADETSGKFSRKGLTEFGKQVVRKMNELGMMVDLSHVGEQTFFDALEVSTKPVIVSHSCAKALCPHRRNVTDEQARAIARNGGVIHLNFYSGFLDSNYASRKKAFEKRHAAELDSLRQAKKPGFDIDLFLAKKYPDEVQSLRPPLSLLIDHLDHLVAVAGIDHVGLGSDFDGIESTPQQMDDVGDYPNITRALRERGYSKKEVRKILGENFLRIFKANSQN